MTKEERTAIELKIKAIDCQLRVNDGAASAGELIGAVAKLERAQALAATPVASRAPSVISKMRFHLGIAREADIAMKATR